MGKKTQDVDSFVAKTLPIPISVKFLILVITDFLELLLWPSDHVLDYRLP